ncbi:unnamed protein product [Cladocopium goreaui]|uniref:t-SNARE coiled-coil homology domain-containing protein n=1 Tax=Cladocopium goreaui TaxID=2562237 RepID=A0A9P1CA53_9DINO|nr:unnamed protein product [Cladocopium goreaui]
MDLTHEFRRLAGVDAGPGFRPRRGGFMDHAEVQRERLKELRRCLDRQVTGELNSIQARVAQLEASVEDLSDLGDLGEVVTESRDQVAHRRGVITSLYEELRSLAEKVQKEQVSQLQREAEVASFFTAPIAAKPPVPTFDDVPLPVETNKSALRAEEQRLLTTFTTDLDKIQETRAKIEEVSSMVGLFATKVAEQTEQSDECYDLTQQSTSYVEGAQKHLERAIENSNSYRFYVVCWFLGSAMFLLVFDYIDARWSPI